MTERLLTSTEVAALFRTDPRTVSRWGLQGRLTCVKTPGGRSRYLESEVRKLLAEAGVSPDGIDQLTAR